MVRRGDEEAMLKLGQLHYYGKGVSRDIEKAKELYIGAARHGSKTAQVNFKRLMAMVKYASVYIDHMKEKKKVSH